MKTTRGITIRRLRMAVLGTILALDSVIAGSPAYAEPPVPQAITPDVPATSAPLKGDNPTAEALAPGCYGQTDRPHLSTHQPGSVNVVARTVCPGFGVKVSTALYRSRWYGWQRRGTGAKEGVNSVSANAAESAAECSGTHDYLGSSYHEASDRSWARTSNRANGLTC
jgi:hypothetical protein